MKKMKKAIVATTLALAMFAPTFSVNAAAELPSDDWMTVNVQEEIARAIAGETDLPTDEIQGNATATMVDEDGTSIPVEVYVTTRQIVQPQGVSTLGLDSEGTIYATTVVARASEKSDTNTGTKEYVTGTITIYWKDVLGTKNEFMGVSGGWTVATNPTTGKKASLSRRYVGVQGVGTSSSSEGDVYKTYPTSNTFEIGDDEYEDGWWAYKARSEVKINNSVWLAIDVSTGQVVIG